MQRFRNTIVFLLLAVLLAGCTGCGSHPEEGREEGRVAQAADTLYTEEEAMNVYGMNPQRALLIIDSAEIVGNEREQLFLDPNFERQTLIKLTGISKNRIGAAFAQGSGHERLTSLVREMRLDYAVRLMNEHPELSVNQVRVASGFTSADTFTRNFRTKYGMTPTAYCASKS